MVSTMFKVRQRRADLLVDWYDFQYKEKYSGEIYLELTFFSNVRLTSSSAAETGTHSLNGPSYRKRPPSNETCLVRLYQDTFPLALTVQSRPCPSAPRLGEARYRR